MKGRTHKVDAHEIIIIDDALGPEQLARQEQVSASACFPRKEDDGPGREHVRTFTLGMELTAFKEHFLFDLIRRSIAERFPGEALGPWRAYCNLLVYGDMTFPHRDCRPGEMDVTALLYA